MKVDLPAPVRPINKIAGVCSLKARLVSPVTLCVPRFESVVSGSSVKPGTRVH